MAALLLLAGCDPTRRVAEGEVLLRANQVEVDDPRVDRSELTAILKQKPNKRVLGVPFYLHVYNLPDPEKIPAWRAKKNARMDRKNARRAAHGREPKPYKLTRAEWLRETVGEAPVILDSSLTVRSVEQLRVYMTREGWFRAEVHDTVRYTGRKKNKARVTYIVTAGPSFHIRQVRITVDDPGILWVTQQHWANTLLHPGDRFDDDVLDAERARLTNDLRDDGYLYFTRDLIQYVADTSVGGHQVDLDLRIERPVAREHRGLSGTAEGRIFNIRDVYISTVRPTRGMSELATDTLLANGYHFIYRDRPPYRPKALLHPVFLRPGERFQQSNATRTYRRLASLNVFDRVEISYDTTGTSQAGLADARITLLPGKPQSFSLEGFATNRGGALGTTVNVGYRHRNLFRTLGSISGQFSLGLEAQQSITGGDETPAGRVGSGPFFNTVSIGPEVTLGFPSRIGSSKYGGGRILVTTLYNYQRRPDYTRSLGKVSLGVQWNESRTRIIGIFPAEVNMIRIPQLSDAFREYLISANDPVLRDSYTDHLITSLRATITHSTPEGEDRINASFLRLSGELAGHPFGLPVMKWMSTPTTDTTGATYGTVGGVRYAEYVKGTFDARWRHTLHDKSSFAFRFAGGAGLPFGNLGVLPFESSFFVGGANGLRAWRARSIGPGSYNAPLDAFDRIGEISLEGNGEYRFDLIGFLEGALFVDVGNIWNWKEDANKPGGNITPRFLSELAIGTGVGARLNFDFFIVRFDLGLQTKDPSLPVGERWLFQPKDQYEANLSEQAGHQVYYQPQVNFNLGIGYPF